ncbi:hypothetical protein JMJ77_0006061 [Colletotrichum scovillei]|uniref:Uncharacterized protein n=1 Tax=Colletotrichum scovillei TaxID=1209932 RepID=A0A9P7UI03_9PEZI|nr:hypothetical protein JMJ77_0006061 [Colletotrichum scovillei]KAG7077266.1 hypothetical protein JMJ76_0014515 [Colletotrichum scovillei]KAG7084406.1 hypothetical protein JMJ78_0009842 [Colletotrichum scovillei]
MALGGRGAHRSKCIILGQVSTTLSSSPSSPMISPLSHHTSLVSWAIVPSTLVDLEALTMIRPHCVFPQVGWSRGIG